MQGNGLGLGAGEGSATSGSMLAQHLNSPQCRLSTALPTAVLLIARRPCVLGY